MSDAADQIAPLRRYDFFSEYTPARSRLPELGATLGRINDRFSRNLRAALLQHLRRGVGVLPAEVELIKHRDLMERIGAPSHLTLVNMKPLRGTIAFVIDAQLVIAIVETRFGGNGRFPIDTNREFTPFELKSMRRVVETALEQFALAWEPFGQFEPEISRHETNPQFAGFATADDLIIVSTFEITVDLGRGRILVCIPYTSVEPLHDQLMSGILDGAAEHDLHWSQTLKHGVEQAAIPLSVELGTIEISIADLAALRPGNVFEMDRPETLVVESGGVPLFRARWGRYGRRIGVRIDERLTQAGDVLAAARPDAGHEDE
jgi:flagellar motor switch protein FliM